MVGWLKDGLNCGGESVGLGLENGSTAALDFVGPVGQPTKEGTHLLADLGPGPEAGVGGHFGADPAPDVLISLNLLHLLWFVSENVIGVAKPHAGASR
jgi:hypothetical protein